MPNAPLPLSHFSLVCCVWRLLILGLFMGLDLKIKGIGLSQVRNLLSYDCMYTCYHLAACVTTGIFVTVFITFWMLLLEYFTLLENHVMPWVGYTTKNLAPTSLHVKLALQAHGTMNGSLLVEHWNTKIYRWQVFACVVF